MDLDELKLSWNLLDKKLQDSNLLSKQIVLKMIKRQSQGTISRMQSKLTGLIIFFSGLFILFAAIVAGNPFDFTYWVEFVPFVLYAMLIATALLLLVRHKLEMNRRALTRANLRENIEGVIQLHQMWKKTMTRLWQISLLAGTLLSFSLVSRNIGSYGLVKSLLIIFGMVATVALMYFLVRLGLKDMPDKHISQLKANLEELDDVHL